jgi:hypothetical protein
MLLEDMPDAIVTMKHGHKHTIACMTNSGIPACATARVQPRH